MERNFSKDGGPRFEKNKKEIEGRLKYQEYKIKDSVKPDDKPNEKPDKKRNMNPEVDTKSP